MDVESFGEIAAEFRRRIERTVWCTMTTVDTRGRPRARLVHPVWEEPTGWLATNRGSFKAKHLAENPWVSLAFWDQEQEQVYVDCHAMWVDDERQMRRLWDLYARQARGLPARTVLARARRPELRLVAPRPVADRALVDQGSALGHAARRSGAAGADRAKVAACPM